MSPLAALLALAAVRTAHSSTSAALVKVEPSLKDTFVRNIYVHIYIHTHIYKQQQQQQQANASNNLLRESLLGIMVGITGSYREPCQCAAIEILSATVIHCICNRTTTITTKTIAAKDIA